MSDRYSLDVSGVGRAVYDHALLLETYPASNQKTVAVDRWRAAGSPVPVALCQLSRWGWRCHLTAAVGEDTEGERVRAELAAEGVGVESLVTRSTSRTPVASIWVEKGSGRRTVVLDRDLDPLSPNELHSASLKASRCLLLDGWEVDVALEAARIAREAGVTVVMDAEYVRDRTDELLKCVDWLIVPVSFVMDYFGSVDLFAAAGELRSRGPGGSSAGVVITNGAGGCVALGGREKAPRWLPAYKVDAVDTTGAGDVFHAGFIHGLLRGWELAMCIRWAAAAAALSTTAFGARGYLPPADAITGLLRDREGHGEDWS